MACVGAIALLGMLIGSLVLTPYADHYGRRIMNMVFLTLMTFAMWLFLAAMVVFQSYWLLIIAAFIGGGVAIPLCAVMICYATELSTHDMMNFCTGISFFCEALTSILIGLYFMYFKDCAVFYLIISIGLTIFLILYIIIAKESPHFSFKTRKY